MIKKAVIDRFEGQQAVLLIDDTPTVFPRSSIPNNAKEGDWLKVEMEKGRLLKAEVDFDETAQTAERIAEKLERLRRGDYKKK